ncbi:MAG: hypothetical protein J7L03_05125 [Caldisericaceae bacterium]|nr:hypothetical protein [Caldisericaceae bacterium]
MKEFNVKDLLDEEFQIFAGRIGSGKTEIAINVAIKMKEAGIKNTLFDMDIVKPYVRIRDLKETLIPKYHLDIVAPPDITRTLDLPIFPKFIIGKLKERGAQKILDVGGDPYGAGAIAQFREVMPEGTYNFFFVVNTRRPETSTKDEILKAMAVIQNASRMKITGIVFNTNLRWETTEETLKRGFEIVKEVSDYTKLPVVFGCVDEMHKEIAENLGIPILPLKLFVNPLPKMGV